MKLAVNWMVATASLLTGFASNVMAKDIEQANNASSDLNFDGTLSGSHHGDREASSEGDCFSFSDLDFSNVFECALAAYQDIRL